MMQKFDSSSQPVAVIGAGVVGTMTARSLMNRGRKVILIDAHDGPAELCSHANAGIMAVGHADAWASPGAVSSMLRALAGLEPSLKVTRLADPALWSCPNGSSQTSCDPTERPNVKSHPVSNIVPTRA